MIKKLLILLLLVTLPCYAQTNQARMISGVNAQTGTSYTVVDTDVTKLLTFNNAAGTAVSLPAANTSGFMAGSIFSMANVGSVGDVTVTSSSTIAGQGLLVIHPGQGMDIYSDSTNYWIQSGSGGPPSTVGLTNAGAWSNTVTYPINAVVQFQGSSYVAVAVNTGVTPGTNAAIWTILAAAGANGSNGINGVNGTNGYTPNQIAAGCGVTWTGNYNFTVGACSYFINGINYNSPLTNITLAAADPALDRFDTIAVDTTGSVVVIQGATAASPVIPTVNLATQAFDTAVHVTAGTTAPPDITTENIYLENTEWTCAPTANFNCASTNNPYQGTKDIEATAAVLANNVTLTKPAAGTVDLSTKNTLVLYVRSKASWSSQRSVTLQWANAGTSKGIGVVLTDGAFNFNSSITTGYQQVSIPTSLFGIPGVAVTTLQFTITGGSGGQSLGFYVDNILLQSGIGNPTLPSNIMLYRSTWSSATNYLINDVVVSGGSSYIAIAPSTNQAVTNASFWTPLSAAVAACAQYGMPYYAGSGTTSQLGCFSPPAAAGLYQVIYNLPTASPVAPQISLLGLSGRSISGATTTATILFSDNATVITHDVGCSQNVSITLPTATTLGNPAFVWAYANHCATHTDTLTPTTWTIQNGTTAAGASLSIPAGTFCRIKVDPNSATNWLTDCVGTVAGTGTVTSVATTAPISGGTIINTGTISCPTCAIGPGASTAGHVATFTNANGLNLSDGGAAGTGTVTSVATTSPITGGTIVGAGTVACATCVVASAPGAGIAHFAGATQTVTSSAVVGADMTNNTVTSTQLAAVNNRRVCSMVVGANNGSVLVDADLGPQNRQCFIPAASTIVEIDVSGDGGTPNVIVGKNTAGAIVNLTSAALATAAAGGIACSNTGGTLGLDTATTCSGTLQNTAAAVGSYIQLVSGTAGGVAKEMSISVTYTISP